MKIVAGTIVLLALHALCSAQIQTQDISQTQLDAINSLTLSQAVKQREMYKAPLKSAYNRQIALIGKDCQAEIEQGQQPYNICMGRASQQAENDYSAFYNNLQMLCHDEEQLATLQASEKAWQTYKDSAMKATNAAWPNGTGAPGFAGQVYVSLVRNRMQELHEIFMLNIAQ
jgi:uncharacterized protein YecT (DUF1311 family)